jgi:ABC-type branched-subunit amino acid transport system substrate-binding protein
MIVDDQESYSTGLAGIVKAALVKAGVSVDSESITQKDTDFSALVGKIDSSTKVVFTPFQLASQTQLLAQQIKAAGKNAIVFATDGSFDSSKFNQSGNYVSFFAADVTTLPADKELVAAFNKAYPGGTSPFGAPNYVAAQLYAQAATKACAAGKGTISRTSLRTALAKERIARSILGTPMSFTPNGDVQGAAFHIFKIVNGKYQTIS